MDQNLLRTVRQGGLVLAANRRLAAHLNGEVEAANLAAGLAAWPQARITTFEAYLQSVWEPLWSESQPIPQPLSELLWERVIQAAANREARDLPDPLGAAALAIEAHALMALYRIPAAALTGASEEADAFARWRHAYGEALRTHGYLDPAELPGLVADRIRTGSIPAEGLVALAGFDEHPPARRDLIEALQERGAEVVEIGFPRREGWAGSWRATDPEEEVKAVARWALNLLVEKPASRIGIIAVRMEEYRDAIERAFTGEFHPREAVTGERLTPLFDMSLGAPLNREGIVETALGLLEWAVRPLAPERARALASSPYLNPEAFEKSGLGAPISPQPPSALAAHFSEALRKAGWGATLSLTSREYQAAEKFRSLLHRMGVYDPLAPLVEPRWVVSRLARWCKEPFRPQTGRAPITVLGLLESGGLHFDHLWLLGGHEGAWPPASRPNPLIPYRVQLDHGVRQASPESTLERARRITERLLNGADEVVVSFPASVEETPATLSPLFAHLPPLQPTLAPNETPAAQVRRLGLVELARRMDEPVPLQAGEELRGGAALLAAQARCPFMAFARHRLGVRAPEEEGTGVDPLTKGAMLHEALHHLHGLLVNREAVVGATPEERARAVDESLALARKAGFKEGVRGRLLEVETERIAQVLEKWLEAECERPEFEVVERETVRAFLAGNIPMTLRIDRIDETDCGVVILDYKSGRIPGRKRLRDERLIEPQLPLYALACPEASGVAWARLDRGECALVGHMAGEGQGGITSAPDWEELKIRWRAGIDLLAAELEKGVAIPDPGGKRRYCEFCGLTPLCRIVGVPVDEEDGDEGEGGQ